MLNEAILYDGLPGLAKRGGVGGAFNLVPKRPGEAPVTDLTRG